MKSPLWNPKSRKYGKIGSGLVLFSCIVWQCPLQDIFLQTNSYLNAKIFNFACAGAFLLLGGVLSANIVSSGPDVTVTCDNGGCTSSVTTSEESWKMTIDCGGGNTWSLVEGAGPGEAVCAVSPSRLNKYSRMLIKYLFPTVNQV